MMVEELEGSFSCLRNNEIAVTAEYIGGRLLGRSWFG